MAIVFGIQVWILAIVFLQFLKVETWENFGLILMFFVFAGVCISISVQWLRNRPRLTLSQNEIHVLKFGSGTITVNWPDVTLIEENVAHVVETGRIARSYRVYFTGGAFRFDTFYTDFDLLLRVFNIQIDRLGLKVRRKSQSGSVELNLLEIVPRGRQGFNE